MANAIEIFVSYERKDEDLRKELENHLSPLQNKGLINLWNPGLITPGKESAVELQTHLKKADIFLLLITANYISSKNYALEMNFAMKQQREGKAQVIPILLSPVYWEDEDYGDLKPLPDNGLPVSSWRNRAEAFFNIAAGIRQVVKDLNNTTIKVPPIGTVTEVPDPKDKSMNPSSNSTGTTASRTRTERLYKIQLKRHEDQLEKIEYLYKDLSRASLGDSRYSLQKSIEYEEQELAKIESELKSLEQQLNKQDTP